MSTTLNRTLKCLAVAGLTISLGGLYACDVEVHPHGEYVAADGAVVDVTPDVFVGYYDAAPGPDWYYHYRFDHGYYYLDRYHRGPDGHWGVEHTYRVPRASVHRQFDEHGHERFEHR